MKVDVKELLESAGLEREGFYPGKRLIKKYALHGDHKSHCMVFTWNGDIVRAELKAGLYGHTVEARELRQFPVSFQAPTYVEIEAGNDNEDEDEDEDGDEGKNEDEDTTSASGKGGGGKQPKKRPERPLTTMDAFSRTADGAVQTLGEIKKFVIMGKEIAQEAYAQAYENLKHQISQSKIMAMDLMKGVSDIIHKATPGGGLAARGDETIKYRYDAEKTAPMFGGPTPG